MLFTLQSSLTMLQTWLAHTPLKLRGSIVVKKKLENIIIIFPPLSRFIWGRRKTSSSSTILYSLYCSEEETLEKYSKLQYSQ